MLRRLPLLLLSVLVLAIPARAEPGPNSIVGVWESDSGKSRIEIQACPAREGYCGRIVWTRSGNPAFLGAPVLEGLVYRKGRWVKGAIRDPRNGATYRARAELETPDRLKVKGCLLIFCDSRIWTRHRVEGFAATPASSADERS